MPGAVLPQLPQPPAVPGQSGNELDFLCPSQPSLIGGNPPRTTAISGRRGERLKQQQLAILVAVVVVVGIGASGAFIFLNSNPTTFNNGTQAAASKTQSTAPKTSTQSAEDGQVTAEIGPMPVAIDSDGTIKCVLDYLMGNLDDPNGIQFVKWSGVSSIAVWDESPGSQGAGPQRKTGSSVIHSFGDGDVLVDPGKYWGVRLKFRSKNRVGALEIKEWVFLIKGDRVVHKVRNEMSLGIYFPPGAFPGDDPVLVKKHAEETKAHSEFVKALGRGEAIGIPHQDAQEKEPEKIQLFPR